MRGIGARDRLLGGYFPCEGAVGLENGRFWVVDERKTATKVARMVRERGIYDLVLLDIDISPCIVNMLV